MVYRVVTKDSPKHGGSESVASHFMPQSRLPLLFCVTFNFRISSSDIFRLTLNASTDCLNAVTSGRVGSVADTALAYRPSGDSVHQREVKCIGVLYESFLEDLAGYQEQYL